MVTMKLKFLGGTKQVGRSAVLLSHGEKNVLLDYGVLVGNPPKFPLHVRPKDLLVVLTHSHLDHVGAAPLLFTSGEARALSTPVTLDVTELLIADFLKLSGYYLPFEFIDFEELKERTELLDYGEEFEFDGISVKLIDAGHIPGSSQVIVEVGDKRVLYTSDINTYKTNLLNPAVTDYGPLDAVIVESTYADEDHPDRAQQERKFVETVRAIVEDGGFVLIPSFAVARAQEVAMILHKHKFKHAVYMDGMAREATSIYEKHPQYLRDPKAFSQAMRSLTEVTRWEKRKKIVKEPGVVIAPAGMLGGGTSVFYLSKIYKNPKNAVIIVGYQIPGTPGRTFVEKKEAYIKGKPRKVEARVYEFRFSSHTDRRGLRSLLSGLEGEPKVFIVHGEPEKAAALEAYVKGELGFEAYVPELGSEYEL